MHNSTYNLMYQNAMLGLATGCLMPWDKQVIAASPIPASVIEPYMTKEVSDVRSSMQLTYETMVVWIDEAKKVNYFSKEFVKISKRIMRGVTTMGRGLVTLHDRGEELNDVPMSIQDLIGVASYHFRKSHLGCLQTVRSHPQISEQLLLNQIDWNNMLMRLFKTREKLAEPISGARDLGLGTRLNEEGRSKKEELSDGQQSAAGLSLHGTVPAELAADQLQIEGQQLEKGQSHEGTVPAEFDPFKVFGPEKQSDHSSLLTPNSSLKAPGAFTAPRALASFDGKTGTVVRNAELSPRSQKTIALPNGEPEGSCQKSHSSSAQDSVEEVNPKQTESSVKPDQSDQLPETQNQVESKSEKETNQQDSEPETKTEETPKQEEIKPEREKNQQDLEMEKTIEETPKPEEIKAEKKTNRQDSEPETTTEGTPKQEEIKPEEKTEYTDSNAESETEETPNQPPREPEERSTDRTDTADPSPEPPDTTALSYPPPRPDIDPEDRLIYDDSLDSLPGYLKILQNVYARSGPSENGELIFTEEEMCYLAEDPGFNEIYPRAAEDIRSVLKRINDS